MKVTKKVLNMNIFLTKMHHFASEDLYHK